MARRTLPNIRERILKTAIQIGAKEGVDNVTARKIAERNDITDATVFVYYQTKENLLLTAYNSVCAWVDKTIEMILAISPDDKQMNDACWHNVFDWLIANVDSAKFFCNYRYSGKEIPNEKAKQKQIAVCKRLVTDKSLASKLSDKDYSVIWGSIMESVAYYAIQVADGNLGESLNKYDLVYRLVFGALN